MCAGEKKDEHARKLKNDGKGSFEDRLDEDGIERATKDEVINAEIKTQIPTVEDMDV